MLKKIKIKRHEKFSDFLNINILTLLFVTVIVVGHGDRERLLKIRRIVRTSFSRRFFAGKNPES